MGTVYAKEKIRDIKVPVPKPEVDYDSCEEQGSSLLAHIIPVRVDRISVDGLVRTKDDFVKDAVRDLFRASTFADVVDKALRVRSLLESLGCFKHIGIYIDTSRGMNATPDGVEVTFQVEELRRLTGGINTYVGNNEGTLFFDLAMPNLAGRGERLSFQVVQGYQKARKINLGFMKPFIKRNTLFNTSIYRNMFDSPHSGYAQTDIGFLCDLGFNSLKHLRHNIQYDGAFRDLQPISKTTSFEVRESSGMTMKSALRFITTLDTRDEQILPTCGIFGQAIGELAGLGGNVGFLKTELYLQSNWSLAKDVTVQLTGNAGVLGRMFNNMTVAPCDVFYLGGPFSVRGFDFRGIGKQMDKNALGTHAFWAVGLHLYTPLPFRPGRNSIGDNFKVHFFVNAGRPDLSDRESHVRATYGLGLAIRVFSMARIEINYCFPFLFEQSDALKSGIQFGAGAQFL